MMTGGDVMESSDNVTEKEINLVPRDDQQIVVHRRDGSYFMDKNKWSKLTLPAEAMVSDLTEVLTQEESLIPDSSKGANVGMSVFSNGNEYNTVIPDAKDIMDSQSVFSKDSDLEGETAGW
jgi:hypothetical protein